MKFLKNKAYALILFITIFTIFMLIYTFLVYKGTINTNKDFQRIICYIIGLVSFLILGLIIGLIERKHGLLSCIITTGIILTIAIIIKIITNNINIFVFIKYLSYFLACLIGNILSNYKKTSSKKIPIRKKHR